ncbi:hypothetical protein Hanom_Chr01g00009311 [Helianthus anomalus]
MEKGKKRAECSGDEGGVVGGEPPEKKHNFTFRLFGFNISCYKDDPGPKDGEGSSGVSLDGVEEAGGNGGSVAGGGGGGDGGSDAIGGGDGGGGSDAVDGEPPVQQP